MKTTLIIILALVLTACQTKPISEPISEQISEPKEVRIPITLSTLEGIYGLGYAQGVNNALINYGKGLDVYNKTHITDSIAFHELYYDIFK